MSASGRLYEIRVAGHLDGRYAEWFEGLGVSLGFYRDEPVTLLRGSADQAALYGVLNRLQALGLVLLAVARLEDEP